MNKNSSLDLIKAYRLAITKNEPEIADLLEHIIVEEICVTDILACKPNTYRTTPTDLQSFER